jgi:hypothetical protein
MAEEYWQQEEQKAEKDYLFLTSAFTKPNLLNSPDRIGGSGRVFL